MEKSKGSLVGKLMVFLLLACVFLGATTVPAMRNEAFAEAAVTPKIACGDGHNLALKTDGTVVAWGYNSQGQLGNGSSLDFLSPYQVGGSNKLTGVIDIACGGNHSLALKSDGMVVAWGYNNSGQIGGTRGNSTTPVPVTDAYSLPFTGVRAIEAGAAFSMALKDDGTVWAWGNNSYGQLGIGNTTNKSYPVQVLASDGVNKLTGIIAIACGDNHALAIKGDGTVYAWGLNTSGQLGNYSTANSSLPVLSDITGVSAVAAGVRHSMALKTDGTVWAWGDNTYGQLGSHTLPNSTPQQISACGSSARKISCGNYNGLAIDNSGKLRTWGRNNYGQLGNGSTQDASTPTEIMQNIDSAAVGYAHGIAIKKDGSVYAWGWNKYGQLGLGSYVNSNIPIQVSGLVLPIPSAAPVAPTNLTSAAVGNGGVLFRWSAAPGAKYYNLKQSKTSGGPYTLLFSNLKEADGPCTTQISVFPAADPAKRKPEYYVITAVNDAGESGISNEVTIPKPYAPVNFTATMVNRQVNLTWNQSAGAVYYNVKRAEGAGGAYQQIATNLTSLNYTDSGLDIGGTYRYVVTAVNAGGESAASREITVAIPVLPSAPTNLRATVTNGKVNLTWNSSSGAAYYMVERATIEGINYKYVTLVSNLTGTSYQDTTVTYGTTYYYYVTALNTSGGSGRSNEAVVTPYAVPAAPANLKASAGSGEYSGTVDLAWDTTTGAAIYCVKRSTTSGGPYTAIGNGLTGTSYRDADVTNKTTYYYVVTASNSAGESKNSNQASATPDDYPMVPRNLTAVQGKGADSNTVTLQWELWGQYYSKVKRSTNSGGPYTTIAENIRESSYVDKNVEFGDKYYYVVTATSAEEESEPSNEAAVTINRTTPARVFLTAEAGEGSAHLSWSESQDASYYMVLRRTSTIEGIYTTIAPEVYSTNYDDQTVYRGTTFYYIVIAVNAGAQSEPSNIVFVTP